MANFTYLYLRALDWTQALRSYPSLGINDEGGYLTATTVPKNCDLILSNGFELKDYQIHISILSGELTAEKREKSRLHNEAMGGLWFIEEQNFVHGYFHFGRNNFNGVWEQVRTGDYVDCSITLGIQPIQIDTWEGNPLSITTASVDFSRQPPEQEERSKKRGFLARLRQK